MKITKTEAKAILAHSKANMECDMGDADSSFKYVVKDIYGHTDSQKVKKLWKNLEKKMRQVCSKSKT